MNEGDIVILLLVWEHSFHVSTVLEHHWQRDKRMLCGHATRSSTSCSSLRSVPSSHMALAMEAMPCMYTDRVVYVLLI